MYNKSISSKNEEKKIILKIKSEDKQILNVITHINYQTKKLLKQKILSKENFTILSKIKEKEKEKPKLEIQKTSSKIFLRPQTHKEYNSASNSISNQSINSKPLISEKKNNLNDETLKKIISNNYNENTNKNINNLTTSSEKLKLQTIDLCLTTKSNEKKFKSLNFDFIDTIKINNINSNKQLHTVNTETLDKFEYPNLDKVKISHKNFGIVEAYSAITTEGLVRNYNEDRVSIILNIPKPQNYTKDDWPKCSFFAIYDGHGGANCSDFLRDNLHKNVI